MRIESEELYVQIGLNPNLNKGIKKKLLPLLSLLSLFTFNSFIFIEN